MYTPFFKFLIVFILLLIIYLIFTNLNEHFTSTCKHKVFSNISTKSNYSKQCRDFSNNDKNINAQLRKKNNNITLYI